MSYYNTVQTAGAELREYRQKAQRQEERILHWFKTSDQFFYTPSEIHLIVFDRSVPLTSVRRAMTNLSTELKLVKSTKKRKGPFGRMEFCWRINRPGEPIQSRLF